MGDGEEGNAENEEDNEKLLQEHSLGNEEAANVARRPGGPAVGG